MRGGGSPDNALPERVWRFLKSKKDFKFSAFSSYKSGFTLAEVLITLGVIGIVAAMTLPIIVGKYQKQVTVSKLQKFYTELNQAIERSEVDHEDYEYWPKPPVIDKDVYFDEYWKPYLKVFRVCKTYKDCGYKKNNPWITRANINSTWTITTLSRTCFYLDNGTFMIMRYPSLTRPDIFDILIDINGSKGPNKYGYDVFIMQKSSAKGTKAFVPYGYGSNYNYSIRTNECKNIGGFCLYKIMEDGWQIRSDYNW